MTNATVIKGANSPFMGPFKITQTFKGAEHDGFDLLGESDEVHATFSGTVKYAGYQNPNNTSEGFGLFVCIEFFYAPMSKTLYAYFGHLNEIKVKTGDKVTCTQIIGIQGWTGYTIPSGPSGKHLHYCIRPEFRSGCYEDVSKISGIPNVEDGVYDDGYRPGQQVAAQVKKETAEATVTLGGKEYIIKITEK